MAELRTEEFTTSGTFTWPAGISEITVECWAAGGSGGGGVNTNGTGGGGGAGGGYSRKVITGGSGTYAVTVGTGGAGVSRDSDGNPGGDSSFASLCIAKGGQGGFSHVNGAEGGQGTIVGAVGDFTYRGGHGAARSLDPFETGGGGGGAGSTRDGQDANGILGGAETLELGGFGSDGTNGNSAGTNAGGSYGGGTGGSSRNGSSGNGADGFVLVSWYVVGTEIDFSVYTSTNAISNTSKIFDTSGNTVSNIDSYYYSLANFSSQINYLTESLSTIVNNKDLTYETAVEVAVPLSRDYFSLLNINSLKDIITDTEVDVSVSGTVLYTIDTETQISVHHESFVGSSIKAATPYSLWIDVALKTSSPVESEYSTLFFSGARYIRNLLLDSGMYFDVSGVSNVEFEFSGQSGFYFDVSDISGVYYNIYGDSGIVTYKLADSGIYLYLPELKGWLFLERLTQDE